MVTFLANILKYYFTYTLARDIDTQTESIDVHDSRAHAILASQNLPTEQHFF